MKFKKSMFWVLALATLPLVACNPAVSSSSQSASSSPSSSSSSASSSSSSASSGETSSSSSYSDLDTHTTLNMSILYQKLETRMKFHTGYGALKSATSYTGPDGTVYEDGDFKPVWAALQKRLNFTINDVTESSASTVDGAFTDLVSNGFKSGNDTVNIAQGNSASIIKEGTTNGTILDLSKYLDEMPNFNSFLTNHPVLKTMIEDPNGAIYYAPYFDGFDDIERMLMVREDWVEKLLDGDYDASNYDTGTTLTTSYSATLPESIDTNITVMNSDETATTTVTKDHTADIITTQNALATKNGATLVKALRDYIDTTYGNVYGTKRSELFIGAKSAYDVDELVALFRCVKTNPACLTGSASNVLVPFFPRGSTNDRTADLWRFMSFWGVRGSDSRDGYLYVGTDGTIHDMRGDEKTAKVLGYLHELYEEGLILPNFTTANTSTDKGDYRGYLLKNDLGFSTYDYNQTTTIYNNDSTCAALDDGKFLFTSILPAVYNWDGDNNYFHYTESWRSVKEQGWFITAATATDSTELKRCLDLFDYLYSTIGNRLMSYGPDAYLAQNEDGTIKTMDYQGTQVPVLSDECKNEMTNLASGNYTNFYRYYLGATFPVGYVKQQGMEYQTVATKALPGLNDINNAIELGVLKHVNFSTSNTDKIYNIIPTTFALTSAEQSTLSSDTNFVALDAAINNTKGKSNIWSNIVMNGWGSGTDYNGLDVSSESAYVTAISGLNISGYATIYNDAYTRMGL